MASAALSPTRALRQPRRVDSRALVGAFLAVVSTLGSVVYFATVSQTRGVVMATRDRPAGAQLTEADLSVAQVRVDDALYRAAIPGGELRQLLGKQLAEPVHTQQLLVRSQLTSRPPLAPEQVVMTIPVGADVAAGARLRPGDQVQVLVTTKSAANAVANIVLARVTVYDVGYGARSGGVTGGTSSGAPAGGTGGQVPLTLILTQEQARELAVARRSGEIDVLLLPPESPAQAEPLAQHS